VHAAPGSRSAPRPAQAISPGASGTYYAVKRGAQGRVVAVTKQRSGKTLQRFIHHYPAGSTRDSSTDQYSGTALIGRQNVKYNTGGFIIRADDLDSAGVNTGYSTMDTAADGGTRRVYTAEGSLLSIRPRGLAHTLPQPR
jgi:hypothetical protein